VSELRIGDADRAAAAEELGEHYAVGRLTTEEHSERLDRIWAARTRSELAPVFADLPGSAYRASTPPVYRSPTTPVGSEPRPWNAQEWAAWQPGHPFRPWGPRPRTRRPGPAPPGGAQRVWLALPVLVRVLLLILVAAVVLSQLPLILFGLVIFLIIRNSHRRSQWGHSRQSL